MGKVYQTMFTSGLLLCSFVFVFILSEVVAYPMVGGSKRFTQLAWGPLPIVYQPRTTRPYAYYDPYASELADMIDVYYPQDPYEKFRLYQAPYYIPEQYYYDDKEEQAEEDPSPYGQENWYNNGNAKANAMFLQNLFLADMYRDAVNWPERHSAIYQDREDYDDGYVYGEPVTRESQKDDLEVMDLKSLVKAKNRPMSENIKSTMENRWMDKRASKPTTLPPETTTKRNKGQDEVVMPRPANPVNPPSGYHSRSYHPSVYETIKKLLIEQKNEDKRQPKKRSYVLNEDSLVEQLGNLKKY